MALAPSSPPDFAGQDAALVAAHARLVKGGFVQLGLPGTSDAAPKIPEWLQHLGEWLGHRPVGLRILFWAGVAALVLVVGKLVYDALSRVALDFRAKRRAVPDAGWWRPDTARARVLLAQADALAEAGRFDEAAHLLLLKSVDDIDERRPGEMRPSLTARDIARPARAAGGCRPCVRPHRGGGGDESVRRCGGGARGVEPRTRCLCGGGNTEGVGVNALSPVEAERPFIARAGIAVAAAAAIAFAAYLALAAFGDEWRSGHDGGAHALSVSGTGFSGIVELLGAARPGPPRIARDPFAVARAPLLVVTPPVFGGNLRGLLDKRDDQLTLVVAPKWNTVADPTHPGWVRAAGLIGPFAGAALSALGKSDEPLFQVKVTVSGKSQKPKDETSADEAARQQALHDERS